MEECVLYQTEEVRRMINPVFDYTRGYLGRTTQMPIEPRTPIYCIYVRFKGYRV
jgi:hypothetical protein